MQTAGYQQQPLAVPDFAFPFTPPDDLGYAFGSDGDDDADNAAMFSAIDENAELSPPHEPEALAATQKKRRRTAPSQPREEDDLRQGSPASSDGTGEEKGKPGSLRLTDAIDKLAAEQEVLKFDSVSQLYIVLDGNGFEQRFDELRCTRAKRSDGTNSRPFSRMHNHYVLVRGEKWAKTGSAFRAKDAVHELPRGDQVQASKINITLIPSDEAEGFQVTLQHFLNVTGAGDLFKNARQQQEQRAMAQQQQQQAQHGHMMGDMNAHPAMNGYQQPMAMQPMYPAQQYASHQHYTGSVTGAMHSMWNQNSKGDQAYFFFREDGVAPFKNGSVVMLREGKILRDGAPEEGCIFLVVSDDNAKWKGEPLPTPEEETQGHWCCFLGQVPVWTAGKVKSGEYLGPTCEGDGQACVRLLGDGWPVVGMAIQSKDSEEPGIVRALAFAGLNAMSSSIGAQITPLFEQAVATRHEVSELREDLERTKATTDRNATVLSERLNRMEQKLMSDRLTKEDEEYLEQKRQEAVAHQLFMRNLALVMMILAVLVTMAVVFFLVGWFGFWGGTKQERVVVYNSTSSTPSSALECQQLGSYDSCVARDGGACEWVNFGDAGSFCLDSSIFEMSEADLPVCADLVRSACDDVGVTHSLCKWTLDGCVDNAVAHQYHCKQNPDQTTCESDEACEWLDSGEQERGAGCVVVGSVAGLCSSLRVEAECARADACEWTQVDILQGECGDANEMMDGAFAPEIADQETAERVQNECALHFDRDACLTDFTTLCRWEETARGGVCGLDPAAIEPPNRDDEGVAGGTTPAPTVEVRETDADRSIVSVVLPAVLGLLALVVLAGLAAIYMRRKRLRDEVADVLEAAEKGELPSRGGAGEGAGEAEMEHKAKEMLQAGEVAKPPLLASDGGGPAPSGPTGM